WIFEPRGVIEVSLDGHDADELTLDAADAGADDVEPVEDGDDSLTIYTAPSDMETVRIALESKKVAILRAESTLVPKTKVDLAEKEALQTLRLIDRLEDLDDVQNVFTNAGIADEVAEKYEG
ncbi:MAG TPA: YebC/PmpR family DNA-binding transcriptional regulator, partial [Ktedonobacterales bacterium]|nr:YebC/PmpR family DNA-binding transcriptional regulator [Ktedonobacterales bacterium]